MLSATACAVSSLATKYVFNSVAAVSTSASASTFASCAASALDFNFAKVCPLQVIVCSNFEICLLLSSSSFLAFDNLSFKSEVLAFSSFIFASTFAFSLLAFDKIEALGAAVPFFLAAFVAFS